MIGRDCIPITPSTPHPLNAACTACPSQCPTHLLLPDAPQQHLEGYFCRTSLNKAVEHGGEGGPVGGVRAPASYLGIKSLGQWGIRLIAPTFSFAAPPSSLTLV